MTIARVKICGITNPTDRDAAVTAGADAVGFISGVPVETPREVDDQTAAELVAAVPAFVTSVLVTMPESVEEAIDRQRTVGADAIQIHETLEPAEIEELSERLDQPVIAAVDATRPDLSAYATVADALLLDSTSEDGGGGTGRTHDWEQAARITAETDVPVVLAGGLDPENVGEAVETVSPFAVDTASGVERTGGEKDHDAVAAFVERARRFRSTNENQQEGIP